MGLGKFLEERVGYLIMGDIKKEGELLFFLLIMEPIFIVLNG